MSSASSIASSGVSKPIFNFPLHTPPLPRLLFHPTGAGIETKRKLKNYLHRHTILGKALYNKVSRGVLAREKVSRSFTNLHTLAGGHQTERKEASDGAKRGIRRSAKRHRRRENGERFD